MAKYQGGKSKESLIGLTKEREERSHVCPVVVVTNNSSLEMMVERRKVAKGLNERASVVCVCECASVRVCVYACVRVA